MAAQFSILVLSLAELLYVSPAYTGVRLQWRLVQNLLTALRDHPLWFSPLLGLHSSFSCDCGCTELWAWFLARQFQVFYQSFSHPYIAQIKLTHRLPLLSLLPTVESPPVYVWFWSFSSTFYRKLFLCFILALYCYLKEGWYNWSFLGYARNEGLLKILISHSIVFFVSLVLFP